MKENPLVTVVMNCYNGEKYLQKAIESVLSQTYSNWEIIFWDNQSHDKSAEIFKSYKDRRFKYFLAPKHTVLYEARNYAISKSSGEYISFLDVDDWWDSQKLEKQLILFDNKSVGLSCSSYFLINERNQKSYSTIVGPFPSGKVLNELLNEYFIHVSTLMIRKEALLSLTYLCDSRFNIIGDLDLVVRLILNWELASLSEPLAYYRWHKKNTGYTSDYMISNELVIWIEEVRRNELISRQPNFKKIVSKTKWYQIIKCIYDGDRMRVISLLKNVSLLRKMRAIVALLLPTKVARKLILK
jgi:glycosyltransferase involved in cell wall biosynthesis